MRRGLLDPRDHRSGLDVATAREDPGRLAGALDALHQAKAFGGIAAGSAEWSSLRVRRRLN